MLNIHIFMSKYNKTELMYIYKYNETIPKNKNILTKL